MPSELYRLLSPVLADRKSRDLLAQQIAIQIERLEAAKQRSEAEKRFKKEKGEHASYETEIAKCANGLDGLLHWFDNWAWTLDPRLIAQNKIPYIPFKPWEKQRELLTWLYGRVFNGKPGLIEKSRDQGATYILVGFAVWAWLFIPGFKTTFCSRDAVNVDSKGDPDSIFEKMRIIIHRLPTWMMPQGFNPRIHDNIMLLTNPVTGSTITGVTGDNPGRGGRSSLIVVDEGAFLAHPARVEAAISGNSDCIIWSSTPNPEAGGLANFFARKRSAFAALVDAIFTLHWRSDPRKTEEWASEKRASMADPGTWDAEYEISYTGATEGVAVPAKWVQAGIDLFRILGDEITPSKYGVAGGDVGAGRAKSSIVIKFGAVLTQPLRRQEADTTDTAYWMLDTMKALGGRYLNFDAPGVGAGVLSAFNHVDRATYPTIDGVHPVNTGDTPTYRMWPDDVSSQEKFGNLKAELWWLARGAFQRSYQHWCYLESKRCEALGIPYRGDPGAKQDLTEIAVMPDDSTLKMQLSSPKWFRNSKGKIVIETKDQLARRHIPSPDDADALVLAFLEPKVEPGADIVLDNETFHRANPFVVT